jgi:hypothetical protein
MKKLCFQCQVPRIWLPVLLLVVSLLTLPATFAGDDGEDDIDVSAGGQYVTLDTDDQAGEAQFRKYQDISGEFTLNNFSWNHLSEKNWFQVSLTDVSQADERMALKAGIGRTWQFRAGFRRTPFYQGGDARLPLGRGANDMYGASFTVADSIQQMLEDPDGDAVPFYFDAAETASDNALVFGLMNGILASTDPFFVGTQRRSGYAGMTWSPNRNWTANLDVFQDTKDGSQAMGSGTYQRISDVNGDGITDYDYFFSLRGVELPAPVDFRTTRYTGSLNYQAEKWNVGARANFSEYENAFLGVTYDNPFWFTDVTGSGALRGVWE